MSNEFEKGWLIGGVLGLLIWGFIEALLPEIRETEVMLWGVITAIFFWGKHEIELMQEKKDDTNRS